MKIVVNDSDGLPSFFEDIVSVEYLNYKGIILFKRKSGECICVIHPDKLKINPENYKIIVNKLITDGFYDLRNSKYFYESEDSNLTCCIDEVADKIKCLNEKMDEFYPLLRFFGDEFENVSGYLYSLKNAVSDISNANKPVN